MFLAVFCYLFTVKSFVTKRMIDPFKTISICDCIKKINLNLEGRDHGVFDFLPSASEKSFINRSAVTNTPES